MTYAKVWEYCECETVAQEREIEEEMNIGRFIETLRQFVIRLFTKTSFIFTYSGHCDSRGMRKVCVHERTRLLWVRGWTKRGVIDAFFVHMPIIEKRVFKYYE